MRKIDFLQKIFFAASGMDSSVTRGMGRIAATFKMFGMVAYPITEDHKGKI